MSGKICQNSCSSDDMPEVLKSWLKQFKLASYQFKIRALERIHLPGYIGSTIRGAFGWAFRQVCCNRLNEDCKRCLLQKVCVYQLIFETPGDIDSGNLNIAQAPRPFILNLPLQNKSEILPGEQLTFEITLIGRANDYLPFFILAISLMGKQGIGKGRGTFFLEAVQQVKPENNNLVYTFDNHKIMPFETTNAYSVIEESSLHKMSGNLELNFVTPGRLVRDGRLVNMLTFDTLVRALLRRVTWMGLYHCCVDLKINFNELIRAAKDVPLISSKAVWYDWERFSQRQQSRMKMGGIVGKVVYGTGWKEFSWLLALGEIIHVGKGATFGLGRYSIRAKQFE